jgi:tRNA-modifying protein YgfZ
MVLLLDEPAVARRPVGMVEVTGPDRLSYLHTMLTQHLEGARAGTVADFLYLDPKANPVAAGRAVVLAERVLLLTPPEVTGAFTEALERFKFLTDVAATDASDGWTLASVRGPGTIAAPGAPEREMTAAPHPPGLVIRDRSGGVDLVGPTEWVEERTAGLGLGLAASEEWEAWRITAGEPEWGREIVPGRRPQELGLLPTHVHLRKGCYPGQESVAKMFNLGRPRRALAVLEVAAQVHPGDRVDSDGKRGEVTSSAPAGDAWVALALLPLDEDGALPDGVTVGGRPGRVRRRVGEGLPIPGAA